MKILINLILFINILNAHPHTFIEVYPNIEIKNKIIEKINFTWKLDEMTSSMLIMEFDQDQNGNFDKKEIQYIYDYYFLTLIEYNFYTDITVKDKVQIFPQFYNFSSYIENNKLCYSFTIKPKLNSKDTLIDFGDTDFFVAMVLKKEFIKINDGTIKVSDLDNDFYFGYRMEFN